MQGLSRTDSQRNTLKKKIVNTIVGEILSSFRCLAFSAFYELIEWWAALLIGKMPMPSSALRVMFGTHSPTWLELFLERWFAS